MKTIAQVILCVCFTVGLPAAAAGRRSGPRPMSVSNRLLLNRLKLGGHKRIQVMVACDPTALNRVTKLTGRLGGTLQHVDRTVGYLRVELPIEHLSKLVGDPSIDAYQIASSSRASWYRDGQPQSNAEMYRNYETNPAVGVVSSAPDATLPMLEATTAQQSGYTADEEMGIEKWLSAHPTFDGRGVTIALIESGQPEFSHPTLGPAKTLDGRPVDKLAGILNTVDPTEFDYTRVGLTREIDATTIWTRISGRTFILPRTGKYFFGVLSVSAGQNLVQQFGVLRSRSTGEVWVDTEGDADFRNERPVLGLEQKFEVRWLKITEPRKAELSFLVASGKTPASLYIYLARSGHQAMTLSVAAGSRNPKSLAYGVASGARVLLVRAGTSEERLSDFIEGYLAAAARPDVDLLSDAFATVLMPDTERDFAGLLFRRIVKAYNKPIFHSAGNRELRMSSASALGDVFSVGGMISPATFAALLGGGRLHKTLVHPASAAGPALDGALKPDFLAPVERIAAGICTEGAGIALPRNQPTSRLPACYRISCCTSASSPYAAGLAALLISAAKQARVNYSIEDLARALRASARFLPDEPAYEQGSGLLDVEGAWRELQRGVVNPHITAKANNHHALTSYAAGGPAGAGIFEAEGWTAGSTGQRSLLLRRDAGPSAPTEYRLSWTGNDGTFSTQPSIVLPLGKTVSLPVTIAPRTTAVHSAILNMHEPLSDAIVLRSMATVVVPVQLESPSYSARFEGHVPLMQSASHFWHVPRHTAALSFELTVTDGAVRTTFVPSHGMSSKYYENKYPKTLARTLPKGTYRFVIADPSSGTWSFTVRNDSAWIEKDQHLVSTQAARYTLKVLGLSASLSANASNGRDRLTVSNNGAEIAEPVIKESWGNRTSYPANFNRDGMANQFDIQVPSGSAALIVYARLDGEARHSRESTQGLDLYLYDCTSGECFSYDFAIPASTEKRLVVRNPHAGRWVAMINGAPSFPAAGSFVMDAIVVAEQGSKTTTLGRTLAHEEERTVTLDAEDSGPTSSSVRVYELFDEAVERGEAQQPWVSMSDLKNLSGRPAALGIAMRPVRQP